LQAFWTVSNIFFVVVETFQEKSSKEKKGKGFYPPLSGTALARVPWVPWNPWILRERLLEPMDFERLHYITCSWNPWIVRN